MEIKTILVATDFSDHAAQALDAARELARVFGARLHLVHAYPLPYVGVGMNVPLPAEYFEELRTQARRQLDEWAQKVKADGLETDTELLAEEPAHCIVEAARRCHADLIVMGTRGLSGIRHLLLGSVAERTIRLAPCPVMAVPHRS